MHHMRANVYADVTLRGKSGLGNAGDNIDHQVVVQKNPAGAGFLNSTWQFRQ